MIARAATCGNKSRAIVLRLALIVVLAMAAFAHRPAGATAGGMSLVEMARYVLPDGSLPVLCLPGGDAPFSSQHCDFCLIAGAAAAPEPASALPLRPARVTCGALGSAMAGPPIGPVCLASSPLRGPPDA